MMHKLTAEKYGAIAGFRTSPYGLAITLLTSSFGFLFGIPGATMIYTNSFTRREDGISFSCRAADKLHDLHFFSDNRTYLLSTLLV